MRRVKGVGVEIATRRVVKGWMGMRTMVVPGLCSGTAVLGGVNEKDGEGSMGD